MRIKVEYISVSYVLKPSWYFHFPVIWLLDVSSTSGDETFCQAAVFKVKHEHSRQIQIHTSLLYDLWPLRQWLAHAGVSADREPPPALCHTHSIWTVTWTHTNLHRHTHLMQLCIIHMHSHADIYCIYMCVIHTHTCVCWQVPALVCVCVLCTCVCSVCTQVEYMCWLSCLYPPM